MVLKKRAKEKVLDFDVIYQLRQVQSKPQLIEFKRWLEQHIKQVPPKSPIGKAIQYCLSQWDKLISYLADGRLEIDNNRTERAVKPFVIGRKNWTFNDSVAGANAASIIFSLIETCKANQVEPYAYLKYVLSELPKCDASQIEQLELLLPFNVQREKLYYQWRPVPEQ